MRKTLRSMMLVLTTLVCGAASAQDVVLDFTNAAADWGIEATSKSKEKGVKEYTNGTYTVTIAGDGANGFAAYDGNILFGKQGAYIQLPEFDFPVAVVQFVGRTGASASTKMNVFVGEEAICKETVGSVEANNYFIPEAYQSGKQYTIKVTSAHNAQLTKINIYKVGNPDAPQPEGDKPLDLVGNGSAESPYTVSDIIALHGANQDPAEAVWVKGIIAGNIDTGNGNKLKVPTSGTDAVASNLAISEGEKFASVQLTAGTDPRAALNLQEHFNYIGTEVAVHGTVTAYCGMAGVKNLDDFVIDAPEAQTLPEGFVPCPVRELLATWSVTEDGKNNVEVSFVTPTEMINQWDYEKAELSAPITKVEIQRSVASMYDYQTVATIYYPAAGENITWTDKNIAYGSYDYQVQVYVADAMDWPSATNVIVGELPADVDFGMFTATADPNNPYQVILEVTLPTLNSLYEPLTMPLTKVEFGEFGPMGFEPEIIYTEDAEEVLVPGSKLQYIVENVTDGNHLYTVQVFTEAGGNQFSTAEVFIGKDQPGMAQNVTATETEEGILVTWEAPFEGMNGGDMGDLADLTYTVKRGADVYDVNAVVLVEDTKELSILDQTQFSEETKFVYLVIVKSPYGESYASSSNELVVGPAAELPYAENFDVPLDEWGNTTTQHSTWSKDGSGWFSAWQIGQEAYIYNMPVTPYSGAGLLYAYYSNWGETHQWDSFTSGNIDFTSAEEPIVSFWLYDLAQGGSDVVLKIQTTTDDIEYTTADAIVMGNAEEEGWRKVTVSLNDLKGAANGKVRFLSEADGENCFSVVIDDILISDANSTGIGNVGADAIASGAAYNLAGQRVSMSQKGLIIVNGKKILNK